MSNPTAPPSGNLDQLMRLLDRLVKTAGARRASPGAPVTPAGADTHINTLPSDSHAESGRVLPFPEPQSGQPGRG